MKVGEVSVGNKVKDRITGFTGIVTCVSIYLNGCERVQLLSEKLKDGNRQECEHIDSAAVGNIYLRLKQRQRRMYQKGELQVKARNVKPEF